MKFVELPLENKKTAFFNVEQIRALAEAGDKKTTELVFTGGDALIITLPLEEVLEIITAD